MHTEICRDFQDGKGGIGTVPPLWAYPKCLSGPNFFMEMLTGERGEKITPKQEPEWGITAWLWDKAPAGLALCLRRQVSVALLGFSKQPFALLGLREKAEPTLQQKPNQKNKSSPHAPAPSLLAGPPRLPHSMHGAGTHQLPVLLAAGQHVPLVGQQYSASDLLMVRALFSCFWVKFFKEKIKQLHGPKGNQGQLLRAASALQETFQNRTRYNNFDLLCHIHSVNSQHSRP